MARLSGLDIGGGPGRYSIFLAQQGHQVTLLDLSGKNIRQAIERAKEADVHLDSCIQILNSFPQSISNL